MKKIKPYVISVLIALITGTLSAILTKGSMSLYEEIITPPIAPPSILFPIVWTALYVLMGIGAAMIYTDKAAPAQKKEKALRVYALSLFVNFTWSLIFFNLRAFFFAFLWLVLLFALIVATIVRYSKINKTAAYLQLPYLLWVAFAGYLTLAIYLLN